MLQNTVTLNGFKPESPEFKPRLVSTEYVKALCSFEEPDLNQVKEKFVNWSQYTEYLIFRRDHRHTGERQYKALKSAKRGNDVYAWKLRKRFAPLMDLPEVTFFGYKDRSKRHKTRGLFVTLTLARAIRLDQAWEGIGPAYNKWITRMRKRYGGITAIRVFEAHKDGWPHIHAILLFDSQEFDAFHYNGVWRVQEKRDLEWDEGWTDVEALSSIRGGISYVVKYLSKLHGCGIHGDSNPVECGSLSSLVESASTLTLSMMWAFRRRAFGISRRLLDSIATMTNSNHPFRVQVDLLGNPVWEWSLLGFWGGDLGVWGRELSQVEVLGMKNSGTWTDADHD